MQGKLAVILVAAGKSSRFGDKNYKKPYAPLAGKAVWLHSAERLLNRSEVGQLIMVISAEDREEFQQRFGANIAILGLDVCEGGAQRADSVLAGLKKVRPEIEYVAVHDAARPCTAEKDVDAVIQAARTSGAAILATPVASTLKRAAADGKTIDETVPRAGLWAAQTPQVFRLDWLREAYAQPEFATATDDAELVQRLGKPVTLVKGSPMNLKITSRQDLNMAEQILKVLPKPTTGLPSHPFAGDDLWR